MLGRYGLASSDLSRINLAILVGLLLYSASMDILLYHKIQSLPPLQLVYLPIVNGTGLFSIPNSISEHQTVLVGGSATGSNLQSSRQTTGANSMSVFSPFSGLSIKLMLMDHLNHYLENPLAMAISKSLHLDSQFLWITPNLLSFMGIVLAFLAGRCISRDGRCWQFTALGLMLARGLMDALDGLVARERMGITKHVSLVHTTGYFVDGAADTLGFSLFLYGCFSNLRRHVPKQYQSLPVLYQGDEKPKRKSDSGMGSGSQWTSQRIFLVVFCFGMQLTISCLLWNYYCESYHKLLETPRTSKSQAIVQNEVLKSTLMWLVIWLWRISNAHALMNWLLFSIFINKMWEFFVFIQYIGFAEIIMLFLFTEIHYRDVTSYINMVP